ncbi:MAG: spermidine synthase [Myxococcota bacterium]
MAPILYLVFFLSGAAALLFETLWFHQASLAFGSSVWASSLVLSSFMCGLALGNLLAGRFATRLRQPVVAYAVLEGVIALTGFALVLGLPTVGKALAPVLGALEAAPWAQNLSRLGFGFVLLLVPATAMGATLPLLVGVLEARDANFGAVLGRLYGWNTWGAVCGALAAELFLVAWLGVRFSAVVAASANLLAAVGAAWVARQPGAAVPAETASQPTATGARVWPLCLAAFGAGLVLLALEVVWFRFLTLFVAGTSLAFAAMLASVLAGIASGGLLAGAWLGRRPDAHRHVSLLAWGAGAWVGLGYLIFPLVSAPFAEGIVHGWLAVLWLTAALSFPVAAASGALFAMLGAKLRVVSPSAPRAAGWLTFWNTAGAGLGSLLGGFVLLPGLGIEPALFVLALAYGGVALACVFGATEAPRLSRLAAVGAVVWLGAALVFPHGVLRDHHLQRSVARVAAGDAYEVVAVREGRTETAVWLRHFLEGEPYADTLVTNNYSMSGTNWGGQRYMKLFTWWPVALHPDMRDALLISYGVGSTAESLIDTRALERIDVVDISEDILELSDLRFPDPAKHPLRDPRVEVHIEDGRYFLETTDRRFDLITGEPPPPKMAGVVNLYTREYFALVRSRLRPGGINTYWLPVHSLGAEDAKAIVRAYCEAFPDCSLWGGHGFSWMLIGSHDGLPPATEAAFARQWQDPVVGPELRHHGIERPEQMGALFLADADQLLDWTRDTPPLTDDHPKRLSDEAAPWPVDPLFDAWIEASGARERFAQSPFIEAVWPAALRERTLGYFAVQDQFNERAGGRLPTLDTPARLQRLEGLLATTDVEVPVYWILGTTVQEVATYARRAARGRRADPRRQALHDTARAYAARDYLGAALALSRAQRQQPRNPALVYLRVHALLRAGQADAARDVAQQAAAWLPSRDADRRVWSWFGERFGFDAPFDASETGQP